MNIIEIKNRDDKLIENLVNIWEDSVKATHLFLSQKEIEKIKGYVPHAIRDVPILVIAENDKKPLGFMGVYDKTLEMLFISSASREKGIGKKLLLYGLENYSINNLTVNEQNPLAKAFYEHMGFEVYKRMERDEMGDPYPLLYMKLKAD